MFSKTSYGITLKLEGFNGLIKYFSERAKIEEEVLSHRIIKSLQYTVDENNWGKVKESIWEDVKNIGTMG